MFAVVAVIAICGRDAQTGKVLFCNEGVQPPLFDFIWAFLMIGVALVVVRLVVWLARLYDRKRGR